MGGVLGYLLAQRKVATGLPQPPLEPVDFDEMKRTLKNLAGVVNDVLERENRLYARLAKRAIVDAAPVEVTREDVPNALTRQGNGAEFKSREDVYAYARQRGIVR